MGRCGEAGALSIPQMGVGSLLWLLAKLPSPNLPSIVGRTLKKPCTSASVVSIGPNPRRQTWTKSRGAPPPPLGGGPSVLHLQLAVSHWAGPIETSIFAQGRLQPASPSHSFPQKPQQISNSTPRPLQNPPNFWVRDLNTVLGCTDHPAWAHSWSHLLHSSIGERGGSPDSAHPQESPTATAAPKDPALPRIPLTCPPGCRAPDSLCSWQMTLEKELVGREATPSPPLWTLAIYYKNFLLSGMSPKGEGDRAASQSPDPCPISCCQLLT